MNAKAVGGGKVPATKNADCTQATSSAKAKQPTKKDAQASFFS
jgi:hypothetical protein